MIKIHELANVESKNIGLNTVIWQYSVILEKAIIGNNCNINCHTFIENNVTIGDFVTIKSGVYLWDGINIESNVFIGPNVTFTNDKYPKSKSYPEKFQKTTIKKGCSVGANATILGQIELGEYSLIGAGSVVTKDVKAHEIVAGNPATNIGWISEHGKKLKEKQGKFYDPSGNEYMLIEGKIVKS